MRDLLYDLILIAFIGTNFLTLIELTNITPYIFVMLIRYWNSCILYLMAAHLCLTSGELIGKVFLEEGKKYKVWKVLAILCVSIGLVYFILQIMPRLGTEQFYVTIGVYLIGLSYDRSFRRTVFVFLIAYSGILLFASLGLLLGYTDDCVRFTDYGAKHTFGMVHPNTAAHIIFVIVFCVWYLFLQKRRRAVYVLFWGVAVFLMVFNRCRTVILMLLAFPLLLQMMRSESLKTKRSLTGLITLFPLVCCGISLLLCIPIDLIHRLTYHNFLFSIGERFVQAGITLREYGLPLIGHPINSSGLIKRMVDGEKVSLFVIDNAYVSYGVIRGLVWLVPCIFFLCLAIRKAWKRSEIGLVVYGLLICIFAILERRGLDPAYNLLFFYPLSILRERGGSDAAEP